MHPSLCLHHAAVFVDSLHVLRPQSLPLYHPILFHYSFIVPNMNCASLDSPDGPEDAHQIVQTLHNNNQDQNSFSQHTAPTLLPTSYKCASPISLALTMLGAACGSDAIGDSRKGVMSGLLNAGIP